MNLPLQGHQSCLFLGTLHFRATEGSIRIDPQLSSGASVSPFLLVFCFLFDYDESIRTLECGLLTLCVHSEHYIILWCKMFCRKVCNNDEKNMLLG